MCLIVRREEAAVDGPSALRQYAHLGTRNYHPKTARLYTDYGLFTADPVICRDVHAVFLQLTSLCTVMKLDRLLHSPSTMAKELPSKRAADISQPQVRPPETLPPTPTPLM